MSDKPQITNLDEAKAAIDEEIKSAREMVALYDRSIANERAKQDRYTNALYTLLGIRDRMEPQPEPVLRAVDEAA